MENSTAYKNLLLQLKSDMREKHSGYYSGLFEDIYDWEREEVEKTIIQAFEKEGVTQFANYFPRFMYYDGIDLLKKSEYLQLIPSGKCVDVASVLYNSTGEEKFLDLINENINFSRNPLAYISVLSRCKPSKKTEGILKEIYVNSDDPTCRTSAVIGLLYNKGLLKNPDDRKELSKYQGILKKFVASDIETRKRILVEFESENLT